MYGLEKWMKRNKKLCVVTGVFGLLVSPFLWPVFLAIIFQSLSLAMPFVVAWLLLKQPWKEKEEQNEEVRESVQHGRCTDGGKMHTDGTETGDIPEDREEEKQKPVNPKADSEKTGMPDEKSCLAIAWYQNEGRERILRISEKLDKEGKKEFSISKDGICSVRQEKRFLRVGVLRGFPGIRIMSAAKELEKDGFSVKTAGDFVWISWKRRNSCAL